MVIAVNTRFLLTGYLEGYGYFIYESFKRIAKNNPQHQFIFIFDRPYNEQFVFAPNITPVIAGPPARHPLLWKLWYDIKVPAILRKVKADVFVSCDGFCSLHTKVPQCLVVHDLSFLHFPSFIRKSHLLYYRRNTPKFLAKASRVATVSEFSKKDIEDTYKVAAGKTDVVYSASKEIFQPVSAAVKSEVKEKYTAGKEYFIYTGAIHPRKNLMNLLKAFSLFKKRQQTGMKLVLAGRLAWKYESFTKSLETYKYRNDVVLTGYIDEAELARLTGAAYAMVYPSLFEGFGVPVLEAMQCGVPVITSSDTSMQEIAKEAALYATPGDINEIAEKMMLIYKDENLKKQLTEKGKIVAEQYSWDKTAELLWDSILKASNK
ncbi:MAG TPA: glycosyltransferase family 1 protein [Chitinophagaceae bacterium]|jgi:glycosyltransferase involved in cell wall biosynthesis|nr:glycosyltransferase family 1 protein [Chitinophagaceae bacterium]HMU56870.1 glycosyltransferase family 1 protein [Chitinophagaceae bacterium]